ncbi:MAG: ribonuclease H-like domain-containing protein [Candidatus Parcubacteria bacterium]|nr:ribonuclease H-like domain-containing protein [Candidatus Parcubacteria bacterium]
MPTLIIDIETVGEDFDGLDQTTQEVLTRWIKKDSRTEAEYKYALANLKAEMGFSPLTGQIVAIGVLDVDKNKGAVYFQAPEEKLEDFEEDGIKFKALGEKEMLENFWRGVANYDEFVTFNGRSFDLPFLLIRSAANQVHPSKNLMSNRYLNLQKFNAKHVDLLEELSFYGAVRRKGSLHLYSRAFGIASPKTSGITGDDVARLFNEKKFLDIARYNVGDLRATKSRNQ